MTDIKENILYQEKRSVVDLNKILAILYKQWHIIALSLGICLFIAYLQLRYTKPLYTATIKLKLEDEKPTQMSDLFKYGRTTGRFDNFLKTESEAIKSVKYAEHTLKDLQYNYSYQLRGKIVTSELYPNPYFNIEIIADDETDKGHSFNIEFVTPTRFKLISAANSKNIPQYNVNDTFTVGKTLLKITTPPNVSSTITKLDPITCIKNNTEALAHRYASALGIEIVKGTSLIELKITNEVPQLASDYLNTFAKFYIAQTISDKSIAADQTLDFIDKQLFELTKKVQKSEYELSDLKSKNNGIELDQVAQIQVGKLSTYEAEKNILLMNQEVMKKLQSSLQVNRDAPINFVIFDKDDAANVPRLLENYNDLVLQRMGILQKNTPQSAIALENENLVKETRIILLKTINEVINKLNSKLDFANKRIAEVNDLLESIPMRQRALINIQRDFKVNEKFYTYLFEKKLETSISKSSITPNASIIQESETPRAPVSPNSDKYYGIAVLIGLSIGIGIIAITRILYQKIPDKETLEGISDTPILGVVKKIDNQENEYEIHSFKNPKSVFSESIRGIRTGISFIAKGQDKKVICVTSTVSGEGKTFCTINLAASFTLLNKKVIIIGCDLRRPKVHQSFINITNSIGLTTFLIGKATMDQIIQHSGYPNLDVITAGPTPPNPSELLQTDEMRSLIETLKQRYDYILIDSAPVGLVSDSLSIMEHSDINLYVIRANYSKRDFAVIPDRLTVDSDIKNLYTVLNAYDNEAVIYSSIYKNDYGGYHSGSGYYYYGGYYGKGGYGYYGKKYNNSYYSGYYSEEEHDETPKSKMAFFQKIFTRKNAKNKRPY